MGRKDRVVLVDNRGGASDGFGYLRVKFANRRRVELGLLLRPDLAECGLARVEKSRRKRGPNQWAGVS